MKQRPCPSIMHLDLRIITFRNVDSFSSMMIGELSSWYDKVMTSIKDEEAKLSVSLTDAKIDAEVSMAGGQLTEKLWTTYSILLRSLPD